MTRAYLQSEPELASSVAMEHVLDEIANEGVECGRGRNPPLRIFSDQFAPSVFACENDMDPSTGPQVEHRSLTKNRLSLYFTGRSPHRVL